MHIGQMSKKSRRQKRKRRRELRLQPVLTPVETPIDEDDMYLDVEVGQEFKPIKFLGSGASGKVILIQNRKSGELLAQKVMYLRNDERADRAVNAEVNVLRNASCKHVVGLRNFSKDRHRMTLHLEYMDFGSLRDIINIGRRHNIRIPEHVISRIMYQVLKGVIYIAEELHIIHRDLKPENILLNSEGLVKICDLGMAGNIKKKNLTHQGTELYMSPERFMGEGHFSNSDIWSAGLITAELALLNFPIDFKRDDPWSFLESLTDFKEKNASECAKLKDCFSSEFRDFVDSCLVYSKNSRPDGYEVINHEFITKHNSSDNQTEQVLKKWIHKWSNLGSKKRQRNESS